MRKYIIVFIVLSIFLCGCSNINNFTQDEIVNLVLKEDINKQNTTFKGYKIYLPKDMTLLNNNSSNSILYSNNDKYYLYVDLISYYNKKQNEYKINNEKEIIYSKTINYNNQNGYILVTKHNDEYFIETMYNYGKIEVLSKDINEAISKSLIVLKSISYNNQVIETLLGHSIEYNEEKFELSGPNVNTEQFLEYVEEFGTYEGEEEIPDEDIIEINPKD